MNKQVQDKSVLEMTGIQKQFGPVIALDNVHFELAHGEIHALLGVNGAGKSTLIKIISGIYTPDEGTIKIDNAPININTPRDAMDAGIAAVQQHPELVGDYSGYENIFLGQEAKKPGLFRLVNKRSMRLRAQELLKRLPVDIDLSTNIDDLPSVEKEIVAVLHSLKQDNIKVLILDEPTSTLTTIEKEQLFKMMRLLKEAGVAIIYITHRLEEVYEIADRFTVFRGGKNVATMTPDEAKKDKISIPQLMLQEAMGDLFPPKNAQDVIADRQFEVKELSLDGAFENITFSARIGEIVGLYGLVGSGIDELAKCMFGALKPTSGATFLAGKKANFAAPAQALKKGVFLVPGDRRKEGLVLTDNVVFNSILARLKRASGVLGFLKFGSNKSNIKQLADQVALSPPTLDRPASAFSGGNQQKIVIAKGLFQQGSVYIFVEPTVGVDVGARATLYALIRELSKKAAIIVMSSDCDEVFGLSDRVSALYRGHLVSEPKRTMTRDQLLAAGITGAQS